MADPEQTNFTTLTVDLLSAYFATNTVDSAQLPELIRSTHEALKRIEAPEPAPADEEEHKPKVGIRKSLSSQDHIISMIDGKPYKMLKRHLASYGLTPAEYRERFKLPRDYPMVAPTYAQQRRETAARIGLGRTTKPAQLPTEVATPTVTEAAPAAPKSTPKAKAAASPATPAAKPRAASRAPAKKSGAPSKASIGSEPTVAAEPAAPKAVRRVKQAAQPAADASAKAAAPKRAPRNVKAAIGEAD